MITKHIKSILIFLSLLLVYATAHAQHTVAIRNLWVTPQVHVLFGDYKVSFSIKDIDKVLRLRRELGDSTYPAACGLDTAKSYTYELYPGGHTEYHFPMQPLLQKGVAVYLLTIGHAVVENERHKKLKEIVADISDIDKDVPATIARFYDPNTHEMIFYGDIDVNLLGKDMGIDD